MKRKLHSILLTFALLFLPSFIHMSSSQLSSLSDPTIVNQESISYHKQSNFIHEFRVPQVNQSGLKGITTDLQGNPWFYHQTNKTSTIIKFDLANNTFSAYPVEGKTVGDNPIINLAGGQIIYDEKRNTIWFTDSRLNTLGSFNIPNGKIMLYRIPTNNSGIMGIVLSPDMKTIWFTEIIGNKIGSLDIDSKEITEFPTGDTSGPTLLTFDEKGQLWVTLSYSNSILKVEPWLLIPESRAGGISEIGLQKPDTFSPFGIAIAQNKNNISTIFISDHGSSRVIKSNLSSELRNYTSYWTSPSQEFPASLPSQVVSDKMGNIYFVQHAGNKISKIAVDTGVMTEFDIPTGPLATVVYLAVSNDASKIWFTEWASNRIGFLDNTLSLPVDLKITSNADHQPITIKLNQTFPLDILITKDNDTSMQSVSFQGIELSLIGMTDSGLRGLTYVSEPPRFNMTEVSRVNGEIELNTNPIEAVAGPYTAMVKISTFERDRLKVSLLQPQILNLNLPAHKTLVEDLPLSKNKEQSSNSMFIWLRDVARYASIGVAVTLIAYLVYRKIRKHRQKRGNKNKSI